jgi:hypothetical protein
MEKELVKFNGEPHRLEVKPITLVYNNTHGESEYLERIMITPEMTLEHFKELKEINPYVACFFKLVVPDYKLRITKEQIENSSLGCRHLIGLFSLSLQNLLEKKKFGWKYPETGLHPRNQLNLAEALMIFSNVDIFTRFIRNIQRGYYDEYILGIEGDKDFSQIARQIWNA